MDKIIVVTGVSGCGKSFISKKLALDFKIDKIIDVDTVIAVCKIFVSKDQNKYLFTTSHEAWKIENIDPIEAYKKYQSAVSKYLQQLVSYIKDNLFIIEGTQINLETINALKSKHHILHINLYATKKQLLTNYKNKAKLRSSNWIENINITQQLQLHNKKISPINIKNDCTEKSYLIVKSLVEDFLKGV